MSPALQIEKQRVRVVPDELETYRGVLAPTKKIVADKPDEGPIEMPKVSLDVTLKISVDFSHNSSKQVLAVNAVL